MGLLDEICRQRKKAIRELRSAVKVSELEESPLWNDQRREMASALERDESDPIRFLAEVKLASPSAGVIRPGADPAEIAREYQEAGASALSILTEPDFFSGDPSYLAAARDAVSLPLLMKDFIVDEWQVQWARSLGADAILLIVASLDPFLLRDLVAASQELGLSALVEVHDERELDTAVGLRPEIIGVNHRNLHSLEVDLSLSARLLPRIPEGTVRVAESGIKEREDVEQMESLGFDALLVGEALMRADSPGDALRELRGLEPRSL